MKSLPPGQKAIDTFPRFGLIHYADRFPTELNTIKIAIGGDLEEFVILDNLKELTRIDQVSDFHCVTTWSKLNNSWSGYGFKEFYTKYILPKVTCEITFVILNAQDGYKTSLPLSDLLKDNVILADRHDNETLTIEHLSLIHI